MPLADDTLHTLHILSIHFHPETVKKKHQALYLKANVQKHSKEEKYSVVSVSLVVQNKEMTVQCIAHLFRTFNIQWIMIY